MKKKIICLILSTLIIGVFAGCDDNTNSSIDNDATKIETSVKIKSVNECLDDAITEAKEDSDTHEKSKSNTLETLNIDEKGNNLSGRKSLNDFLHVNTKDESISNYKKQFPEEDRTVVVTLQPEDIVKFSKTNYQDLKQYDGKYIRLENCSCHSLSGSGSDGTDETYKVTMETIVPKGNDNDSDIYTYNSLDYTDSTTTNFDFNKDEKIIIEGKLDGEDIGNDKYYGITLKNCRVVK